MEKLYRWCRLDQHGLELLRMTRVEDQIVVRSNLIDAEDAFAVDYEWHLDAKWRTRSLRVQVTAETQRRALIERTADAKWNVDGIPRADLDGCDEVDLQVTPFCNALGMRRVDAAIGGAGELIALYVMFPELTFVPSKQRYERISSHEFRYVDLGAVAGFSARLTVDDDLIVQRYEGLFEAIQ